MNKLIQIINKHSRRVIGLMSGTSLDGVDIVDCQLSGSYDQLQFEVYSHYYQPFGATLKKQITDYADYKKGSIALLNKQLGEFYLQAIQSYLQKNQINNESIDLISMHGQTVEHQHRVCTYQIGEADIIAQNLETIVIHDFRQADLAQKGSGAPLIPYFDQILALKTKEKVIFQNLGGIGNFSYFNHNRRQSIAADTGPANMLSDCLINQFSKGAMDYDDNGALAAKGQFNQTLFDYFLTHPFLNETIGYSLGREDFGHHYAKKLLQQFQQLHIEDILRTALYFTVWCLKRAYSIIEDDFDRIIINGGGTKNQTLMQEIEQQFAPKTICCFSSVFNVPDSAKEALAFAVLAHEKLNNQTTNIPEITKAEKKVCLGKIACF